jgi:hypothetical protein
MATRRKNILGIMSGRLGNTITRIRYGKEVIYSLPDKVKISNSEAAKGARKRFGLTVNFAKFINSIPFLSAVWSAAKVPGVNSYQRLIKLNSKLTGEKNFTVNNIITPPGVLPAPLIRSFQDGILELEIDRGPNNSVVYFIHIVFCFYEPSGNQLNDFFLEYIQKEIDDPEMNEIVPVSVSLNGTQQDLFDKYKHCIVYAALTSSEGKAEWSSTSAFSLK